MTLGVDVSHYQTSRAVADAIKAYARFVIVKATQGTTGTDSSHGLHVATARAGNVEVGHYHFAQQVHEAPAELQHFLATAQPKPGDAIALDLEQMDGNWSQRLVYALTWARLAKARTFARPLLYMNKSWMTEMSHAATPAQRIEFFSYPLWIATGGLAQGSPGVDGWTLHQFSTAGGIDHDLLAPGASWAQFAIPLEHPNTPTPPPVLEDDDMRAVITEWKDPAVGVPDAKYLVDMAASTRRWLSAGTEKAALAAGAIPQQLPAQFVAGCTPVGPAAHA